MMLEQRLRILGVHIVTRWLPSRFYEAKTAHSMTRRSVQTQQANTTR